MCTYGKQTPPPHQRRKQRGRRRLAEAAVALASKHGFGNVTVVQIAKAADYSASTFFRHFKTKEDAVFLMSPSITKAYVRCCGTKAMIVLRGVGHGRLLSRACRTGLMTTQSLQ
ncbi:TetR/AcrR family transcriptional regulator [Zhongshania guokunii]|uniref:TetR/AcrR family transcriptional regulator n=1 Tax=Zhongshania guokunii TaxID=641783 RepID=A0ABV3UAI0_9GAMM